MSVSPEDKSRSVTAPSIVRSTSLERDPLKRSFKNFLWKTWHTLGYPDPTDLQYDMADWLQYGPDKSVTMAFRGAAKSYEAVTYCVHALYCNPDEIVLTTSATGRFASLNAQFAFSMISQFDWLAHMIPRTDQKRSSLAFDVKDAKPKKSESFAAESIFGQITGRRGSLIVPDDIETPDTCDTETKRGELTKRFGELAGACLLPMGRIKVLGTAQNERSMYIQMATNMGFALRMWPILYPTPKERPKLGQWLAPKLAQALDANPQLADTSTEPTRFDEADIAARELVWGRTEFARQFKLHLDAGADNATPLKLRDLMVLEWAPPTPSQPLKLPPEVRWGPSPENMVQGIEFDALTGDTLHYPSWVTPPAEWRPVDSVRCYVDPSGGGKDETTWTISATLNAVSFTCAQGARLEGYSASTLQAIAEDCIKWGVGFCKVESNLGLGMFSSLLRAAYMEAASKAKVTPAMTIEDDRKGQVQKEVRIISILEPVVTGHRMVWNLSMLRADYPVLYDDVEDARRRFYRLTYQFTRITREKGCLGHDDRVDCLASDAEAVNELLKQRTKDAQDHDRELKLAEETLKMIEERKRQGLPTYGAEAQGFKLGRASKGGPRESLIMKQMQRQRETVH